MNWYYFRYRYKGYDRYVYLSESLFLFLSSSKLVPSGIRQFFSDLLANRLEVTNFLILDKEGYPTLDYITLPTSDNPDGRVNYSPYAKREMFYTEDEGWEKSGGRVSARVGKWLGSLFDLEKLTGYGYDFGNHAIEALTNAARAYANVKVEFTIVQGTKIAHYYREKNYSSQAGTLGKSCMKHGNLSEQIFAPYTTNPNCALLVTLDTEGKVTGRALLWSNVHIEAYNGFGQQHYNGTGTFMDRIYTIDEKITQAFVDHAYKQGWFHKTHQSANSALAVTDPNGVSLTAKLKVETGADQHPTYGPYVDTLCYLPPDGSLMLNYCPLEGGWMLRNQHGGVNRAAPNSGARGGRVYPDNYIRTDLHGMIEARNAQNCAECGLSGDKRLMKTPNGAEPNEKLCDKCLLNVCLFSTSDGVYIKATDSVYARSIYGWSFHHRNATVLSKAAGHLIAKRDAVQIVKPEDFVLQNSETRFVWSDTLKGHLLQDDAVLVPFLRVPTGDYIHKDDIAQYRVEARANRDKHIKEKLALIEHVRARKTPDDAPFKVGSIVNFTRYGTTAQPVVLTDVMYDSFEFGTGWGYRYDGGNSWIDAGWFVLAEGVTDENLTQSFVDSIKAAAISTVEMNGMPATAVVDLDEAPANSELASIA